MSGMDAGNESEEHFLRNGNSHHGSRGSPPPQVHVARTRAPRQRLVFADPAAFRCVEN
jgi:hypothetical protein